METQAKITTGSNFDFGSWESQLFAPLTSAAQTGEIAAAFNAAEIKMHTTGATTVDSVSLAPLWASIARNITPDDLEKMRAALILAMIVVGNAQTWKKCAPQAHGE